jgi:uncharacterized membrane protein
LFDQLLALWPKLFDYLLSFVVVAIFWVKHHTTLRHIKAFDAHLIWLNMSCPPSFVFQEPMVSIET